MGLLNEGYIVSKLQSYSLKNLGVIVFMVVGGRSGTNPQLNDNAVYTTALTTKSGFLLYFTLFSIFLKGLYIWAQYINKVMTI